MGTLESRTVSIRGGSAIIRAAEPGDAAATVALRAAMAQESEFLSSEPGEVRTNVEEQASFLASKLASPADLYILAEVEGQLVGLASLEGSTLARFKHGVTLGLGIRRDHWRRGLGTALTRALLDWADSRGIIRVALEVVEANTAAIQLYATLGFEHEGRLRCSRRHGDVLLDNHLMARIRRPASA